MKLIFGLRTNFDQNELGLIPEKILVIGSYSSLPKGRPTLFPHLTPDVKCLNQLDDPAKDNDQQLDGSVVQVEVPAPTTVIVPVSTSSYAVLICSCGGVALRGTPPLLLLLLDCGAAAEDAGHLGGADPQVKNHLNSNKLILTRKYNRLRQEFKLSLIHI